MQPCSFRLNSIEIGRAANRSRNAVEVGDQAWCMTQHLTLPIRAERSPLLPHTHSFVTEVGADLRPQRQRMMKIRAYQQCLTDQVSNCDLEQLGVHVER